MTTITLPHNFEARPYQYEVMSKFHSGIKRIVLVWNRRAGKDTTAWQLMIMSAYEKKGIYYYVFPTFAQGRKVLWDGMTNTGFKFIDYIPKALVANVNNQEMKIRLTNGSLIQVVGSDNYDAVMGTNPSGVIFSEYALQNPNVWQYMRPIVDANDGWAMFIFTPRGSNHAKDIYDTGLMPQNKNKWFCQCLTNNETKIFSDQQIQEMRDEGMSEDMIQQEIFCSFTLGIQGSYFAKYMEQARNDGRICNVPHDKHGRVFTSWDLGFGDSTSIIWFQIVSNEVHIIDFYEDHGKELAFYAKILADKPYIYDKHFVPHDVSKHELSTGLSVREVGSALGLQFTILPTLLVSHSDTIECCRGIFPRIWIDEKKCQHLIRALENYRCEYDEGKQMYKPKPVHDKWSHASDSFRYLSLAVRRHVDQGKGGPGDDWVEGMLNKYQPKF